MLQKILVIFFIFVLSLSVNADDKLKMKTGSYMSGEVLKLTKDSVLIKMKGLKKPVELQWDVIDKKCKKDLISKYGFNKIR